VLPDMTDDLALGIRGLPHRFGPTRSILASGLLLFGASLILAFGPNSGPGVPGLLGIIGAGLLLGVGWIASRRPGSRVPFSIALAVAVLDVALLLSRGHHVLG
jgi:4-hydroxybenzoate polyprenyltransferase